MPHDREQTSRRARTTGRISTRGLTEVGVTAIVVAAALLQFAFLAQAASRGNLGVDLKQAYLPAADAVLAGENPYPEVDDAELGRGDAYVYPPLVALATIPLTFLGSPEGVATALALVAVVASLLLVGLRDWRCHAAALAWVPVFHGVQTANVTLVLLLGIALAWRLRDNPRAVALATGLTVAAKLVSWPLARWLAATRRFFAAVGSLVVALSVTLGLWAVIGFEGLTSYWSRVNRLAELESPDSYTLSALVTDLGGPELLATATRVAIAGACVVAALVLGRRGDDVRAFSCAVVAVVAGSPIVWLHSFAVLLVPLALSRPRFSFVWLLPATLWFASGTGNGTPTQTALVLVVMAVVALSAVLAPRRVQPDLRARPA